MRGTAETTFAITPRQSEENAFAVGVNHLSLGQVEATLALLRAGRCKREDDVQQDEQGRGNFVVLPSPEANPPFGLGESLTSLVRNFMKRFAAAGAAAATSPIGRFGRQHDEVKLHPSFRVAASSIAPCVESLIFAVANTPGACDVKVWWDDELVVLLNVLIHATANMFHARGGAARTLGTGTQQQNIADLRNALLRSFDFMLEHDPECFGEVSMQQFVAVVEQFDGIWAGADDHNTAGGAGVCAAFDMLMSGVWGLTSCFFSQASYAAFFAEAAASWDPSADGLVATASHRPEFVMRILMIASTPPPDPQTSLEDFQRKAELRRQRIEDSLRYRACQESPVTFARASYLKATEGRRDITTPSQAAARAFNAEDASSALLESLVPSSLFSHEACRTDAFRTLFLDVCSKRRDMHRFAEAYALFLQESVPTTATTMAGSGAPSTPVVGPAASIPLADRTALYAYTTRLLSQQYNTMSHDAFTLSVNEVIDFLVSPSSSGRQRSLFATLRSFFEPSALEALKPFVCFELYGRRQNRDRFRLTGLHLSLQDHELLVDVLSTSDAGGRPLVSTTDHVCAPFVNGLRLCLRVAQLIEKHMTAVPPPNADGSGGDGNRGHLLLMDLLDTRCNVVQHLSHQAQSLAMSSPTQANPGSPFPAATVADGEVPQTAARLHALIHGILTVFSTCDTAASLTPRLATSIEQQRLLLKAINVLRFITDRTMAPPVSEGVHTTSSSSKGGSSASACGGAGDDGDANSVINMQGFEELVKAYAATASTALSVIGEVFPRQLSEVLIELVVSMTAQMHLVPHLESPSSSSSASMLSGVTGPITSGATARGGPRSEIGSRSVSNKRITTSGTQEISVGGPAAAITPADRKRSLRTFCAVVGKLKAHMSAFLSDDVRCLLQDIVFRASYTELSQTPERSLIDTSAASSGGSSPQSSSSSFTTFGQSPFRFLLEAALNANALDDMEEVLLHLFSSRAADGSTGARVHPALLFAFISSRLRAIRSGQMSLSSFVAHLGLLETAAAASVGQEPSVLLGPHDKTPRKQRSGASASSSPAASEALRGAATSASGPAAPSPLIRLEELWFHSPSALEHLLEVDAAFVRKYQQSILQDDGVNADVRAVSRRFEDVMRSLGVHPPTHDVQRGIADHQRDRAAMLKYLSGTETMTASLSALENYLRSIDRISRVSCSSSATADDLLPLLSSVSTLLDEDPSDVWVPVFGNSDKGGTADHSAAAAINPLQHAPIKVSTMVQNVKLLSDVIARCTESQQVPPLPSVIQRGHDLLFDAVASGALHKTLFKSGASEHEAVALSTEGKTLLLRIVLTEFLVRTGRCSAAEQLNVVSAVQRFVSPQAATIFLFVFCDDDAMSLAEQTAWLSTHAPRWLYQWMAKQRQYLQTLQHVVVGKDAQQRAQVVDQTPLQRATFYFSIEAQLQATGEVLTMLCSEQCRDEPSLRMLCESIPMERMLPALQAITNPDDAANVRASLLDALLRHMTTLRGHQIVRSTGQQTLVGGDKGGQSGTNGGQAVEIPEAWCHLVEELLFRCCGTLDIVGALMPKGTSDGTTSGGSRRATSVHHPLHTLLPLGVQRRILQRIARRVAVELHCDPEDEEHGHLSSLIGERMEQIVLCVALQDGVRRLFGPSTTGKPDNKASVQSGPPCIRLLMLDPIPVELVVTQLRGTDDALKHAVENSAHLSRRDGLFIRAKHLALVRANGPADMQQEIIRALSERYSELLRLTREEALRTSSRPTEADFKFMQQLSLLIKSELTASPGTSGAMIQRIIETLLAAHEIPMDLLFRIVRFVTESTMTQQVFATNARWVHIATGLKVLHALAAYDGTVTPSASAGATPHSPSSGGDTPTNAQSTPTAPSGGAVSLPRTSSTKRAFGVAASGHDALSSFFGRDFIPHPLLLLENLIMSERVAAAACVLHTLCDAELRQQCDKMLLRYARLAVDVSRYADVDSHQFPYSKELTEEPVPGVLPLCPPAFAIHISPNDDDDVQAAKRRAFRYASAPHVPMFRRLVELVGNRQLAADCAYDFAVALFDALGDYPENHVIRALVIDTAEQLLGTISEPTAHTKRLSHYLQISRHLVVCKWEAHPSREELESEQGVMDLITALLEQGHNNGAFSIAEACHLDVRVIHSLWTSRTTHLLNLGLFEEASNTLGTLPPDRVKAILSNVLETVECTPMPLGFRAVTANGSYTVKQSTMAQDAASIAAEVQSLMTRRRIGVRSLLSRFGAPGDVMAFSVRSMDFAQAFPIVLQLKKDDDALLKDLYLPVEHMQCIDAFKRAMLLFEPSLERLRFLLILICKHLEGRQEYAQLLSWQEFMCDYSRAAQTAVQLATAVATSSDQPLTFAQRMAYLGKAEQYFIEAKFQPASKQAPPQHSEGGVLLPPSRLDGQRLTQALVHCRLQKDVWTLLHQHSGSSTDVSRFSLYGGEDLLAKTITELLMMGKQYFEAATKTVTNLGVNVQHVYAPVALQLLRAKKADVVEQLCDYTKKCMLLAIPERNAILCELFKGCESEYAASSSKKALKLYDILLDAMTTDGGYKARVLTKLKRWPEALNEAIGSKDKQVIIELYEKASAMSPQDDETMHVANATRQYLARNNLRM